MGGGVAEIRTSQEQIIVEAGLWLHSSSLYDSVLEILHSKKKIMPSIYMNIFFGSWNFLSTSLVTS